VWDLHHGRPATAVTGRTGDGGGEGPGGDDSGGEGRGGDGGGGDGGGDDPVGAPA
jgi:hypothetical protein